MANFKPMNGSNMVSVYKNHLLNGDVLKIDAGGYDQIDLIPREMLDEWHARENVGCGGYERLPRCVDQFREAIKQLRNEGYVVMKKACDCSGCCQYHANRYYLAEEV